jgi:hypothetical protein
MLLRMGTAEGLWLRHGRNSIHRWNLLIKFSSRILLFCGRYDTDISFRLAQPLHLLSGLLVRPKMEEPQYLPLRLFLF